LLNQKGKLQSHLHSSETLPRRELKSR